MKCLLAAGVCGLIAGVLGGAEVENLLPNGNFETLDLKKFPVSWSVNRYNAEGTATVDGENAAAGKNSVQLELNKILKPHGFVGLNAAYWMKTNLESPRRLTLSFAVSAVELKGGSLVVIAGTREKPQMLWKTMKQWKGDFEWRAENVAFEVPAGVRFITVSFRNNGGGTLWVDDVKLNWAAAAAPGQVQP